MTDRILSAQLRRKIMTADEAATLVGDGETVAMSGFTYAGAPKAVPPALARRTRAERERGGDLRFRLLTGASTGPEVDRELGSAESVAFRFPYQSDAVMREKINAGAIEYQDMHLSHAGTFVRYGYYGRIDVAVVEVTRILEDGALVLSDSVGLSHVYLERADRVILEVNEWLDERLEGMHDVYDVPGEHGTRREIPIFAPDARCGARLVRVDPAKVVAVVKTQAPEAASPFKPPEEVHQRIAGHILDFLGNEVKLGRLPRNLTPIQSGVGNIPNAVLIGLNQGKFEGLTAYTEVIQDGMLDLFESGKLRTASACALTLSSDGQARFRRDLDALRERIVLRPQDVSNNPEIIRRLGCIAMNGFIEADIYGHVNSTHIVGKGIENGIGGSGDFARNSAYTIFMSPSTAKDGRISAIVPFTSHVDHTEHDVSAIVTEWGLADLRAKSPKQKAREIIERCAHPDFRPLLWDYFDRAYARNQTGRQSPHLYREAFGFHSRFVETGDMRPAAGAGGETW
ncbi:MAG: succinate CoA transferase [Anaeromyxobacteraceae bacterium]